MSKSSVVKVFGGIGLAAVVTLGASACSSTKANSNAGPTVAQAEHTYEMQHFAQVYRGIFHFGATLPTSAAVFEEEMAPGAPGDYDSKFGGMGIQPIPADEHDAFMAFGLKEASKSVAAQQADLNAILGISDQPASSQPPAPTPSPSNPASAPSTPAPAAAPAPSQAYTDLQGNWSGTGISFSLVPDPNNPAALDLANNGYQGSGVPSANQLVMSGSDGGTVITFSYDLAQNRNTMTATADGLGAAGHEQVTRS
jgi:hypothetical protein